MDVNKVWLSGLVVSRPILTRINSKTPFSTFNLQVNEKFKDRGGHDKIKPNIFRIESLGRSAELTAEKVIEGQRFHVEGYLREDNRDGETEVRVRTFVVYPEESVSAENYRLGLRQALQILVKHGTVEAAVKELESLCVR